MGHSGDHSRDEDTPEPVEIYRDMIQQVRSRARGWKEDRIQPEDVWDVAFREGFFKTLSENPDLSFEFLLITDRGPTWHYKYYLNTAKNYDDVLALVALSALINDALH